MMMPVDGSQYVMFLGFVMHSRPKALILRNNGKKLMAVRIVTKGPHTEAPSSHDYDLVCQRNIVGVLACVLPLTQYDPTAP